MFTSMFHRYSALAVILLLFSAGILASASNAQADILTYDITPFSYADSANAGYTATITGTITVSGPGSIFNTFTTGDTSNSARRKPARRKSLISKTSIRCRGWYCGRCGGRGPGKLGPRRGQG